MQRVRNKNPGSFPAFTDNSKTIIGKKKDQGEPTRWIELTYMSHISNMDEGVGFGELALINDSFRNATIYTLSDTWFATLSKADFKDIMGIVYKQKIAEITKFLRHFIIFNTLTTQDNEKLSVLIKQEEFKIGHNLIKEGDFIHQIFLVHSGEYEITKTLYFKDNSDKFK